MLTGDLTDFSLREILGFLASTSSSGVLELTAVGQRAGVVLHEGGVCVALREVDNVRGLVARLVHAGALDATEVRELAADGAADAVDLAGAIASRAARRKATAGIFHEHSCEIITWLTLREGLRFSFARSQRPGSWALPTLDHHELLDDVDTCAAGWDELSDIAGDLSRLCSPVPQAPSEDGIILTGEQWRLLSLVDGRRSLADVVELGGLGYLATCRQLRQLIDDGLVEVLGSGATSQVDELLSSYDIAPRPVAAVVVDAEPARARGDGGGDRDTARAATQPLLLSVAPEAVSDDEDDEADEDDEDDEDRAEVAGETDGRDGRAGGDAADAGEDDADGDDVTEDANRQLLRRLMSRRSAGA